MKLSTLCYIEQDEKYLMLYRNAKENDLNEGKWIGVGGKFECDESPEECLLREVKEETGLILTNYTLRGIVTFVSDEWETQYMHLYMADRFEGTLSETCTEGELSWIPKEQILSLPLWEGDRIFLRMMQEGTEFFSLKLCYEGDCLVRAVLDGKKIMLPTVRTAQIADVSELQKIESVCFPKEEAASFVSLHDRVETFGEHFLVLELEGKLIGFINGMVTDDETISDSMFEESILHNENGKWQSVFGLDVLPAYRRQGYAERLMNALIHQAKKEGRDGLILTCKEKLIHYYEKFGYKNMGVSDSVHGGAVWYDMILKFKS